MFALHSSVTFAGTKGRFASSLVRHVTCLGVGMTAIVASPRHSRSSVLLVVCKNLVPNIISRLRSLSLTGERGETMIEYAVICSTLMFVVTAIGGAADYGRSFSQVAVAMGGGDSTSPASAPDSNIPDNVNNNSQDPLIPISGGGTEGFDPIHTEEDTSVASNNPDSIPESSGGGSVEGDPNGSPTPVGHPAHPPLRTSGGGSAPVLAPQ